MSRCACGVGVDDEERGALSVLGVLACWTDVVVTGGGQD